jgi:hypothetical protein
MYYFFALHIFLSSFLIFLIQPIFTQLLLPHLGNAPLVWDCSMIFYQMLLLVGYLYAYMLSHFTQTKHKIVLHVLLLLISLYAIPIDLTPYISIDKFAMPQTWLFAALMISVGIIFTILSSITPVQQDWFASIEQERSKVYSLYSISNFGNLIALILYPLILESWHIDLQKQIFSLCYLIFIISSIPCIYFTIRESRSTLIKQETRPVTISIKTISLWLLLAFIPSSLMLGVTSQFTENLRHSSIFWLMPLILYLLSYILAFLPNPPLFRICKTITPLFILATTYCALQEVELSIILITLYLFTFFLASYVLTTKLANLAPLKDQLTLFYLIISVGSILGSVFNAIIAPIIFNSLFEYPLVNLLACFVILQDLTLKQLHISKLLNLYATHKYRFSILLIVILVTIIGTTKNPESMHSVVRQERNFFGINRIIYDARSKEYIIYVANQRLSYLYDLEPLKHLNLKLRNEDRILQIGATNNQFCKIFPGIFEYLEPNQFIVKTLRSGIINYNYKTCAINHNIYVTDPMIFLSQSTSKFYEAIIIDLNALRSGEHFITLETLAQYKLKLQERGFMLLAFHNGDNLIESYIINLGQLLNMQSKLINTQTSTSYMLLLQK